MPATVSIVIPCFNGRGYVGTTIESALQQSYPDIEVIVVDDGSTDDSVEVIQRVGGERVSLIRASNGGVARARNLGLEHASPDAKYVMFLDADDVLRPDTIQTLSARLEAEPDLVAAFGLVSRIDAEGTTTAPAPTEVEAYEFDARSRARRVHGLHRVGYWNILPVTPISAPGQCLARRGAVDAVGGYDVGLRSCEDWDLWLRVAKLGPIGVVQREVLQYRDHPGSKSKRHTWSRSYRDLVYAKNVATSSDADRGRAKRARAFGMFGFDMRMCFTWMMAEARSGHVLAAARYGIRGVRYAASYTALRLVAKIS